MPRIQYTLVTDGSSDQVLRYPIDWLLGRLAALDFDGVWANPAVLEHRSPLDARIRSAVENFPCDLLFVHRDAEGEAREVRVQEIERALTSLMQEVPAVCVVPVRMTEAWLLIDEKALREAAGNPNGRVKLKLPKPEALETIRDPKKRLFQLLGSASELRGRRLKRFREGRARYRLAELIDDYAPLEALPAFRAFRADLERILDDRGWA